MKRISLLVAAIVTSTMLYSQNVNYVVEVVDYYAGSGTDDGFGFDEEPTWKSWGKDNTTASWSGGVCESIDGDAPITHNTHSNVVLLQDSNTVASFIQIRLEAWEDDDISNAPGSSDRCSYNGGGGLNGDDNYIFTDFTAINFRAANQCEWKYYDHASGDFRISFRVKWEYTGLTAISPINGCDSQAQLSATGSGEWNVISGTGGTFTDNFDTSAVMNGFVGQTYLLEWSQLPNCINTYTTQSVTVNMLPNPVPGLTTNSVLCENGDLIFTASNGVNYDWATGTVGNIVSTTSNGMDTIFNVTSGGLPIFVTVTDANGCSASESWTSVLTSGPLVDLGNDTTICSGTTATLDAWDPTPYSYLWNNGETASIINPSAAGQYIVKVTDFASQCSGFDTVNVSLFPASVLFLGYDVEFCLGDTVILDAQAGFSSYLWSDGSTNQTDTITTFGDISVTIVDANTCVLQDTINFSPTYTYYSLYNDTTIFLGNSVTLTGPDGVSHGWNNGDTAQEITVTPIQDTTYIVTALQENGCYDVADVTILINNELNFFIPNLFTPNGDNTNDIFLVYGNGVDPDNFNFYIYNRWGEVVFETSDIDVMSTTGWDGTFNGEQQPVGTYVWTMNGYTIVGNELQFNGQNSGTILLKR